ncbi:hypothetical protein J8J27_32940, partial [Mycobacterium tuberculosis]|nr:hypothetical protein [Mycobacterium tuberculosis]
DLPDAVPDRLGGLILAALGCDDAARYRALAVEWDEISEATPALRDDAAARAALVGDGDTDSLHQYFQVVLAVVDNHGRPVPD